ncbi:uncharacterized protein EKO05_0006074 [Ascochyta rabiei]|uniref:Uncharacterized protein n=1 Tax=Didymella rabiei TaxID=5454 RepID=A0A163IFM2_DIDRA|nr:uncharacterized protein EKO05_0006074 [Ascochyta rabiei]KZM25742.1 hypothetical protein ST47_g3144 [Ascochyta rabiei]UPX15631.1 hypothetical protein EKO05_0006074 [Ascochyta rabiei]
MTPMTIAPLLKEAAELKIIQYDQLKQGFKTRYGIGITQPIDVAIHERVAALVKDIQQFDSHLENDDDLTIMARYVEQTENENCISNEKLQKFEEQLLEKLHKQTTRFEATSLHLDLMREAMNADHAVASSPTKHEHVSSALDDDFEVVENGLEELLETFEAETFTVKNVDVEILESYLAHLMEGDGSSHALSKLRESMHQYGNDLLEGISEIEEDELEWCIMDLLKNDLISNEKKKTLEGYMQNSFAIKELLGAINLKSIRHWNWTNVDKGLPVTARQDADGQHHITVEEDLGDMLFLHCTAIGWAQKLKSCLSDYAKYHSLLDRRDICPEKQKEREFFLGIMPFEPVEGNCLNCKIYYPHMPPPLPPGYPHDVCAIPTRRKKSKVCYPRHVLPPPPPPHIMMPPPPPPPPPVFYGSLDDVRHAIYMRDFFMSRLPVQDGCRPKFVHTKEIQSSLIKTLAAEIKLRMTFDQQYGCSVVDFNSLASALPHQTVLAVLKFIGVPEAFVDFFARFLAATLNLGPAVRGTPDRVLTRACGVPDRHGLELLFTEAVMFFAELAVSRKTGVHLYRLGAKCYVVGAREQREQALRVLSAFSHHTGLGFENFSTHSEHISIGFLELTANNVSIKSSMVEAYAHRVKTQLSKQSTVYDWIRVWNNSIGNYTSHLFGPLAEVFDQSHLEAIKSAHKRIFDIVLEGSSLTDYVKHMLRTRSDFARTCPPLTLEAMIYLPQAFGGLGVKNPFVKFNLARKMIADPNTIIQGYLDAETSYYEAALRNWSALKPEHISKKLSSIFQNNDEAITAALGADCAIGTFISKESLTTHREYEAFPRLPFSLLRDVPPPPPPYDGNKLTPHLDLTYQTLLLEPFDDITASERVKDDVRSHGSRKRWDQLSPEDKWVLQLYGDDCLERYGTLEMWFEKCIPMYCMSVVRGVIWEDDGDDDDDSSVSTYMTSVA